MILRIFTSSCTWCLGVSTAACLRPRCRPVGARGLAVAVHHQLTLVARCRHPFGVLLVGGGWKHEDTKARRSFVRGGGPNGAIAPCHGREPVGEGPFTPRKPRRGDSEKQAGCCCRPVGARGACGSRSPPADAGGQALAPLRGALRLSTSSCALRPGVPPTACPRLPE
jgi:hypothetical protein